MKVYRVLEKGEKVQAGDMVNGKWCALETVHERGIGVIVTGPCPIFRPMEIDDPNDPKGVVPEHLKQMVEKKDGI